MTRLPPTQRVSPLERFLDRLTTAVVLVMILVAIGVCSYAAYRHGEDKCMREAMVERNLGRYYK